MAGKYDATLNEQLARQLECDPVNIRMQCDLRPIGLKLRPSITHAPTISYVPRRPIYESKYVQGAELPKPPALEKIPIYSKTDILCQEDMKRKRLAKMPDRSVLIKKLNDFVEDHDNFRHELERQGLSPQRSPSPVRPACKKFKFINKNFKFPSINDMHIK